MDTSKLTGFLLLTVVSLCRAESDVELEIHPPGQRLQGDTIRIICRVTNPGLLDLNKIVRVVDNNEYSIMINNQITELYKDDPRYTPATNGNNVAETEVVISNAKGDDSGRIGCSTGRGKEAFEDIEIHVPVSTVEIQYSVNDGQYMAASDGEVLNLNSGDSVDYKCTVLVEGSDQPPVTTVTLFASDITDQLSVQETPVEESKDDKGIIKKHFSAVYKSMDTSPVISNIMYDGNILTCTATNEYFDPVSMSVELMISYPPNVHPDFDGTQMYKVGEGMEVKVDVRMSPKYSTAEWSWGEDMTVQVDESIDRFTAYVEELGSNMFRFKLSVETVTEEDNFENFNLYVKNDVGEKSIGFKLQPVAESTLAPTTSKPIIPEPTKPQPDEGAKSPITDPDSSASSILLSSAAFLLSLVITKLFS